MKMYSLAKRNFKEIYRDPVTILLGLAMPVGMLLVFSTINKRLPLEIYSPQSLTPGIVIFSFTFIIMFAAVLLSKDKQSAFLVRLFTTPLKSSDYILSYIFPFLPFALFQLLVCFIIGSFLGASYSNLLLSVLLFLVLALMCISIGVIIGSLFSVNQVSGIGSLLITAIGLFSGVWMDLRMVGGVFEAIGYLLPFAHAVDAAKTLVSGSALSGLTTNLLVVFLYTIALLVAATFSFRRTMKKV